MKALQQAEALKDLTGVQNPGGWHKVSLESALILGSYLEEKIPPPTSHHPKITGHKSCRQLKGTVTMQNLQLSLYLGGVVVAGPPGQSLPLFSMHNPGFGVQQGTLSIWLLAIIPQPC